MEIKVEVKKGRFLLTVDGDLDMYNTPGLKDSFNEILGKQPAGVLLNLAGVGYLDSSGVGILLYMQNTITKQQLPFCITGVREQPAKVLELTKLTNYFPFADNVSAGFTKLIKKIPRNTN